MPDRRCLLAIHAHPDDESSKGAGTIARYHAEGVRTVLVCCTGGEEGDLLNPAMDSPENRDRLPEIRLAELERATRIIGYDEVAMLGYRDSGMPGTPANERPDSFAVAPLDQAVGRLVAIVRRERPHVMITYPEEQTEYPHPDHLRVHEISMAAFDAAGDPERFPNAGEPFTPLKLYYTVWPRQQWLAMHEKFLELGLESPFDDKWLGRLRSREAASSAHVDITGYDVRREALRAHQSQVDPTSRMWFGLPPEVQAAVHPFDDYLLARSRVGPVDIEEDDLFAGVEAIAGRP
jgi:mycothiol S-conjugate amidase